MKSLGRGAFISAGMFLFQLALENLKNATNAFLMVSCNFTHK